MPLSADFRRFFVPLTARRASIVVGLVTADRKGKKSLALKPQPSDIISG
jgi:hypothetical protein